MFTQKKIAVGVTGGIAAYKTCDLIRELKKAGAEVQVAMTESASRFVAALTFASLSEKPVLTSLFGPQTQASIGHIELARWCDVMMVCPATANFLGKVANGLADDVVSTTIMACDKPVVFCPAMNSSMYAKPVIEENMQRLRKMGYEFVEPEWGALATRSEGEGWGRLASTQRMIQKLRVLLFGSNELHGKKVLVTAGPTTEPLDPVRYLTNYSSGKMGFALAEAALLRGAEVALIAGPNHLDCPDGVKLISVATADEMKDAVETEYPECDVFVMAAAVSDYKPKRLHSHKLKKKSEPFLLELARTPDILGERGATKNRRIHIGFALETENSVANATKKLHNKNLDFIVLNNPLIPGAGFKTDTNLVTILENDGSEQKLPKMLKRDLAVFIIDKVCDLVKKRHNQAAAV